MNFDDVLRRADVSNQQDVVGLAIYFLDRVRGVDPVDSGQVKALISESREEVPSSNVSTYLNRLRDRGLLAASGGNGYRLKSAGLDRYSEMADLSEYESRLREEDFIEYDEPVENFYGRLIDDINHAYQVGLDSAALILSRKLLENLVLDLLRLRYGLQDERKELFYDTENGRLLGFSRLLDNLKDNFDDDFDYWSDRFDENMIREIEALKGRGDATAHSIEDNVSEELIEDHRSRVNPVVGVLFYVKHRMENSDSSQLG